ncbi:proline racemase family protein [Kamptonema cortianum]|nr:proline racemase family protein [Kamptonema cortianum]
MKPIRVIDSHTGGEPTRIIIDGFPELTGSTMQRCDRISLARFDHYRVATVCRAAGIRCTRRWVASRAMRSGVRFRRDLLQ